MNARCRRRFVCVALSAVAWVAAFPHAHGQVSPVQDTVHVSGNADAHIELPSAAENPSTSVSNTVPAAKISSRGKSQAAAKFAGDSRLIIFPRTLLWQPPYANQNEPRTYVRHTSLEELGMSPVDDVAIGGTIPLFRLTFSSHQESAWQFDLFGMMASRFVDLDYLMAMDYRFGVPITFLWGRWSGKIAYEHTSTHIGDEYIKLTGRSTRSSTRDDIVVGLAYDVLEALRVHGVVGLNLNTQESFRKGTGDYRDRYSIGAAWSRPTATGLGGQPFVAVDLEYRGDLDYTPNLTVQTGWQWLAEAGRPGVRFVAEYYDGRTPFGQFLDRHENRASIALYYDF